MQMECNISGNGFIQIVAIQQKTKKKEGKK